MTVLTVEKQKMKYVLITGGVVSGLGKGVTASSIGVVLKACGLRVTSIKIGSLPLPIAFLFYVVFYNIRFFSFIVVFVCGLIFVVPTISANAVFFGKPTLPVILCCHGIYK